jgi:hypothetical protein
LAFARRGAYRTPTVVQPFIRLPEEKSIRVLSEVNPMYTAIEPEALIDGVRGTTSWRTGEWQSYPDQDFEAIVDLKKEKQVFYVGVHVFQFLGPSIVYPKQLVVEGSIDGKTFFPVTTVNNTIPVTEKGPQVQQLGTDVQARVRYLKVKATGGGRLPAWHENPGGPSRVFISEVIVREK